jgi:hypothetical protein
MKSNSLVWRLKNNGVNQAMKAALKSSPDLLMLPQEHRYKRIPAGSVEAQKLYKSILESEEARKRYIKGFIGQIVRRKKGPLKFEDIDEGWELLGIFLRI